MALLVTRPRLTREYETIFILKPDVLEDEKTKVVERVEGIIERLDGHILRKEEWGKRRLSYRVKKNSHGVYLYYRFLGYNDLVGEIERNLRILEPVIKFITVKIDEVDREARIAQAAREPLPSFAPPSSPERDQRFDDEELDDDDADEEDF